MDRLGDIVFGGLVLFVLYQLYSGRTWVRMRVSDDSPHVAFAPIDREEHPQWYWTFIVIEIAMIAFGWFFVAR